MVGLDGHRAGLTFPLLVKNGHCKSCISTFALGRSHLHKVRAFPLFYRENEGAALPPVLAGLLSTWI